MSAAGQDIFDALAGMQPGADTPGTICVSALVADWLRRGPAVFAGADRECLDALCRQVDVRKKVSAGYGPEWTRLDPEVPAEPVVVSGLVAVMLANAAGVGSPGSDGSRNDGWGLKCTNSALKALELREHPPYASELRIWAMGVLDRIRDSRSGP